MASALRPPPGRGRAALLIGGAFSAGLLLAGCDKLSELLEPDVTAADARVGAALFELAEAPAGAPAADTAPADSVAAAEAAAESGEVTATSADTLPPFDTHGLVLRPQPIGVDLMMAAVRESEPVTVAAAQTAVEPPAEGAAASATEAALPFEMVPAMPADPASGGGVVVATAVVAAPMAQAAGESEGEDIGTLLSDLFTPLLEPTAGPAMASVGGTEPIEAGTAQTASLGVIAPAAPDETASIGFAIGPEVSGSGDLTGLTEAEVERLLGPPLSVRRDDPAESWQYATGDCILDLFFYEQTGAWRVVHMEARTIAALDAPADSCVKSVLAGRLLPSGTS